MAGDNCQQGKGLPWCVCPSVVSQGSWGQLELCRWTSSNWSPLREGEGGRGREREGGRERDVGNTVTHVGYVDEIETLKG